MLNSVDAIACKLYGPDELMFDILTRIADTDADEFGAKCASCVVTPSWTRSRRRLWTDKGLPHSAWRLGLTRAR